MSRNHPRSGYGRSSRTLGVRRGTYFRGTWYQTPKEYYRAIRNEIVKVLGGKCVRCGFGDSRALQADHVNGLSNDERIFTAMALLRDIEKSLTEGTNKYQCLCANCNWIKKAENDETNYTYKRSSIDYSDGGGVS